MPPKQTICQQLRDTRAVAKEIGNHEIVGMISLAIQMAKKMDARLRYYSSKYDQYWWRLDQPPERWVDVELEGEYYGDDN